MDAFAVAICKGLSVKKVSLEHAAIVGVYFGGFQALMPLIGYLLGSRFHSVIADYDHWIAFVLLLIIGARMIQESRSSCEALDASFGFKTMLPLAVATSVDALAIGVTLAFLQVNIVPAVILIGLTTFVVAGVGVSIGNVAGSRYGSTAELFGGAVLILIGIRILFDHLGILW